MAFVNEKISDQDKKRLLSTITFEKVKERDRWIHGFHISTTNTWTCDHDRGVYLVCLVGKGREDDQLAYYALGIENDFVIFKLEDHWLGDESVGMEHHWTVHDLKIPKNLESRKEEIKLFIREGLKESAYFRPFANGGTRDNPNTVERWNILSFNVEFK
ncbi:hypothetical protein [Methylomonas rivi]|uniref:Uncharacterized protein n=1 Tax=Methylomonas rivi TaxID=2952226 RepID=A0ABT1UAH4_9GAMM|nr:hypothetical protein [Methylomonas sp. WSC-6]MCQ8130867.1 hypothetical protein [Methylomonas sp. WSC-6]